mmetsp:Transcript_29392/g.38675  ORF Transcript_29392/g.38675 Transcript_29392/m.38675 type:complete len:195 (+) Transcript_29392:179-763(+)
MSRFDSKAQYCMPRSGPYDWMKFPYWKVALSFESPLKFASWLNKRHSLMAATILLRMDEFIMIFKELKKAIGSLSPHPKRQRVQNTFQEWIKITQPDSKQGYWYNFVTGKTQWNDPKMTEDAEFYLNQYNEDIMWDIIRLFSEALLENEVQPGKNEKKSRKSSYICSTNEKCTVDKRSICAPMKAGMKKPLPKI